MYRSELLYFVVFTVIILSSSFLPTTVLLLLDNIVVRIAMVIALLYLIGVGPTAGIFGLMTIAILYLERNRRKVSHATQKLDQMDTTPPQATIKQAFLPSRAVPDFDRADPEESTFMPEASASSEFESVASTINQKGVLSTIYPDGSGSFSQSFYEDMGFGHLHGVETIGEM
jgi:hypothetical protein